MASGSCAVARIDYFECVTSIHGAGGRTSASREGGKRSLEDVTGSNDSRLAGISREELARISIFPPREAGDPVVDTQMRCRATIQSCRNASASPERRSI